RAATQALGGSVRTGGAYWFISSRGEFKRIELPDDRAAIDRRLDAVLALMARGIRTGVFPAVPGTDDYLDDWQSNCHWCPFDALCSANRDQDWQRKQTGGCESFTSLSALTQTGATHGRD
ncbi:MAG TPA: PD-(D/E)XK nuclease family protein, partial [Chloroflexota bacterium]